MMKLTFLEVGWYDINGMDKILVAKVSIALENVTYELGVKEVWSTMINLTNTRAATEKITEFIQKKSGHQSCTHNDLESVW